MNCPLCTKPTPGFPYTTVTGRTARLPICSHCLNWILLNTKLCVPDANPHQFHVLSNLQRALTPVPVTPCSPVLNASPL